MRAFSIVFALALACSSNAPRPGGGPGGGPAPRMDLHCTPQPDFDEAACAATGDGCAYGPPLICRGTDVDDATHEEERRAYEAGTRPCTCVCPASVRACAMVP